MIGRAKIPARAVLSAAGPSRHTGKWSAARNISTTRSTKPLYASRPIPSPSRITSQALPLFASSSRSLSWTPWRSETPSPTTADKVSEVVSNTGAAVEGKVEGLKESVERVVGSAQDGLSGSATTSSSSSISSATADISSTVPNTTPSSLINSTLPPTADPSPLLPQAPANPSTPTIESLIASNPDNIAEVLQSEEAIHAAMKVGDLKLMGLDHSVLNPAGWIRDALELVHVSTGMPWWGTILATTICLRLALVPILIRSQAHNARLAALQPQQKALMEKLQQAQARGDQQTQRVYGAQLGQMWAEHNVHPVKALALPMLQAPLFIAFFFAVRKMAALPVPQLKEGGLWWFTDLTVADPYWILPIASVAVTLVVLETGADGTGGAVRSRGQQHMINGLKVFAVASVPFFFAKMAAALTFYWTISNTFTLAQSTLMRQKPVKRFFGIHDPPAVPLPPNYKPEKPPTIIESFKEIPEFLAKRAKDAAEMQAKQRMAARKGEVRAQAKSSLQSTEVIRESTARKGVVTAQGKSPLQDVEVIRESATSEGSVVEAGVVDGPVTSAIKAQRRQAHGQGRQLSTAEKQKEARIAAARERRKRQSQ